MTQNAEGVQSSGDELENLMSSARQRVSTARRRDPVVSALIITILLVIIFAVLTVAYALFAGVFGTGAPRTMGEKKISGSLTKIEGGSKYRLDWLTYIFALTDDGQYREAQKWIDKGQKALKDQDIYQDMVYAQADLYAAQGKDDQALKTAETAIKQIKRRYEEGKVESAKTGRPDTASARGYVDTYWELLLLKAEIFERQKQWKKALAQYDEYLQHDGTAATVFTQRGVVKEKLGDKKGAEADYRKCLVFIPDDSAALAGLKRIGAAQ